MHLIAGATGYIGGLLAARLAADGREIRCLARDPDSAADKLDERCEIVRGDVLDRASLDEALRGIDVAYYLVHSMGRGGDSDFEERDRRGARNFAAAAAAAGVERIVYLGGLGDPTSPHLRSRHETAELLGSTGVPLTYFRASIVIGSGSESLRTIAYLVRRLPAMVTPSWTSTRTQPIAAADVVAFLAAALDVEASRGREIEIGGREVTTYGGLLDLCARAQGKRPRPRIAVPLLSPGLSSHWIGLVTPVDAGVARPLVEGLTTETVVEDPSGMELFGVEPTPLDQAMRTAVAELF
jgi:uncharacterized protein YbjT (DUF2867 family)